MARRRIRGSKGPVIVLIVLLVLCTGAVYVGKFVQENFIGVVQNEVGLKPVAPNLPPNPARQSPQM